MLLRVLFIHRTSGSKSEVFSSRIPAGTIWVADSRSDKLLHCLPLWWLMYIPYQVFPVAVEWLFSLQVGSFVLSLLLVFIHFSFWLVAVF